MKQPKYCFHRATGQAYVTIAGKVKYLGKFDSPESRDRYDAEISKWAALNDVGGRHSTAIGVLCLKFIQHAECFYVGADGKPTGEVNNFRYSLKPLVRMFRHLPCAQFGPLKLKAVRNELIKSHCRTQVNKHVFRIRQVFRWGVENELLPGSVVQDLSCVRSLARGRSTAIESDEVKPVDQHHIDSVLAELQAV